MRKDGGNAFPLPLGTMNAAEPEQSGGMSLQAAMSAELKMLERLFAAEIEGRLFQSKAAMLKRLEARGYVEARQRYENTAIGPMRVSWWELTHLGRLTYCASCSAEPQAEKDK